MPKSAMAEPTSVPRATDGDASDARLRAMVERFYPTVWRALRRLGVGQADAEDVAQDVFIAASRRLPEILEGRERAFLLAVAVHHAAHARRSRLRRREASSDALTAVSHPSPSPDELAERSCMREVLYRLLDDLPFEQRAVFVLYEIEQLTMAEIAGVLDVPAGTVASRLRKARETFLGLVRGSTEKGALRGESP